MSLDEASLEVSDVDVNPFVQFARWFDEAEGVMGEREAVALATATPTGVPSVRMVLLRLHDDTSFGWYTNYDSRKAHELSATARAAILWYCEALGRQIRVEGVVHKMTDAESDAYFVTRERGSQLGSHASLQSRPLASRELLEERVRRFAEEFSGGPVPRPTYWGGFRLTPRHFEFWQHRSDRLHDRVVYSPLASSWRRERQSP